MQPALQPQQKLVISFLAIWCNFGRFSVLDRGKRVCVHERPYATSHMAMLDAEAYFYRNDFYPFVRAELKEHDPAMFELLVKIWGEVK